MGPNSCGLFTPHCSEKQKYETIYSKSGHEFIHSLDICELCMLMSRKSQKKSFRADWKS